MAPSRMIFGGFGSTYGFEGLTFASSSQFFTRTLSIPSDGAWVYGRAGYDGSEFMDCLHRYVGLLEPNATSYEPFFSIGATTGDACLSGRCFSCSINYGGVKGRQYFTTQNYPAFVPGSSSGALLNLKTMNQPPSDVLTIWLAQVNADAVTDLNVFHAASPDDPGPATVEEIDARTYVSGSDDRVLLVPEFTYGTEKFPATPQTTFEAIWDTGAVSAVVVRRPVRNGHVVLVLSIPRMKTGRHTVMVKAKLPSGRSYSSQAVDLYVHEQIVYLDVDGVFDVNVPVDDLPGFVPGSNLQGRSVDLLAGGQKIIARVVVPKGGPGEVRAELTNVTRWPGIAMNAPLASSDTSPDLVFESGFSGTVAIQRDNQPRLVDVPILIRDYAAGGTLKVTIPDRRGSRTVSVSIPTDVNRNRLPDIGWRFVNRVSPIEYLHVPESGLTASSDGESMIPKGQPLPAGGTGQPKQLGISGDGLVAFEEYRGFFVDGLHTRTNPHRKDLFVDIDRNLRKYDNIFLSLALTFHYIESDESRADGLGLHPWINFNRSPSIEGSSDQYALRIRERESAPTAIDSRGTLWPGEVFMLGRHFSVGDDLDTVYLENRGAVAAVNDTRVVEIYPRAFGNDGIVAAPNESLRSTPPCTNLAVRGCDEYDVIANEIRPGPDQILNTLRISPDLGKESLTGCAGLGRPVVELIDSAFPGMRSAALAHEAGHGLMIDHADGYIGESACGETVMYSSGTSFPVPLRFIDLDKVQIRTHTKHP